MTKLNGSAEHQLQARDYVDSEIDRLEVKLSAKLDKQDEKLDDLITGVAVLTARFDVLISRPPPPAPQGFAMSKAQGAIVVTVVSAVAAGIVSIIHAFQ